MPGPVLPEGDLFLNADGSPALLNIVRADRTIRIAIADGGLPPSMQTPEYQALLDYFGQFLGIPAGQTGQRVAASGDLPDWHYPMIEDAYRTFAGQLGLQVELVPADSTPPPDIVIAPVYGDAAAGTGQGLPPLPPGSTEQGVSTYQRPQVLMYNLNSSNLLTDPAAAEKVITHEAGHTLGFTHPMVGFSTNQPYYDSVMHQMLYTEDGSVRRYFDPYAGANGLGTRDVENAHLVREWVRDAYPNPALDLALAVNTARTAWNIDDILADAASQGTSPLINIPIIADAPQGNDLILGSGDFTLYENDIYASNLPANARQRTTFFGVVNAVYGGGGNDTIQRNAPFISADSTVTSGSRTALAEPEGDADSMTVDNDLLPYMTIASDFEAFNMLKVTLERVVSVSAEGDSLILTALDGERIVLAGHFSDASPLAALTVLGVRGGPQQIPMPASANELEAFATSIEAITGRSVLAVPFATAMSEVEADAAYAIPPLLRAGRML